MQYLLLVHDANYALAVLSGYACNFLLLYLIHFKTNETLSIYSRVLKVNCVLDLVYTTVTLLVKMQLEITQNHFFLMSSGVLASVPQPYNIFVLMAYKASLFMCFCYIPIPFIFRYAVICRPRMLKYWQYWALMGIGAGLSSVDVTTGIWALFPSTEVVYAKRHLLEDHPIWRDVPMPNYVVVDLDDYRLQIHLLFAILTIALIYLVVAYCAVHIWWTVAKANLEMSDSAVVTHTHELTRVLVIQAAAPLLICAVPFMLTTIAASTQSAPPGFPLLMTMALSWLPTTTALSAVLLVPQYRRSVLGFIKRKRSFYTSQTAPLET
ncbi:Protein STR-86 [Aphelenchoides avenae]|nr:Protein STR-86 [Aphelenchus avenae]